MNGPDELLNPLEKASGAFTDPNSQSFTDPNSQFVKEGTPGTDPTSPLKKMETPGTDALSSGLSIDGGRGAINWGDRGAINWGDRGAGIGGGGEQTESASGKGAGRGVLGAIIVVCLLGLVGGGLVLVPKFFLSASAPLNPGVYAWEGQASAQGNIGSHANGSGPDVATACRKAGGSSLEEHLIGGGFDITGGSDPTMADPDKSTTPERWRLHLASGKATSYAICLREPPAFFSPANAPDYVSSSVAKFNESSYKVSVEASCPSGESILGGGYQLGGAILSNQPALVSGSYPIVDDGGARWHVAAEMTPPYLGPTLQAFAICSGALTTHLEHTAMKVIPADTATFVADGAGSCSAGTLLSGGFYATDGANDLGLDVHIQTNAPGKSLKVNATTGDTFTDWTVVLNGVSHVSKAKSVTSDAWVVCWDANAQPQPTTTTPTTQIGPTPTPVGVAQPTPTPATQPTSTPRPQPTPTNTPAPQCQVFMQGSASNVNVDLSDINLDGLGPATRPNTSSHIRYSQTPAGGAIFSPVNSSALHDVGIGADYGALDCTRLRGFNYSNTNTAPYTVGEVFAVKTAGGHYAKVLITAAVGGPIQVQWTTYSVS